MPSATAIYNTGRWLNAADLVSNPNIGLRKRITAVVHDVEEVQVGLDQKNQLNLSLVSKQGQAWPKTLLLNKGNTMQMVSAYGDDYSQWPGKTIQIWAENVMFQGKSVPGIKVDGVNGHTSAVGQQSQSTYSPQASTPPPPPPSATAVAGIPPVATASSLPKQSQIEDDEIPF